MEIKTINLKGKQYSPVSERVKAIHNDFIRKDIVTEYEFKEGYCIFKATITIYNDTETQVFTGHAFGKVASEKAFEKLESVAVGRALAFAGYLAGGEIASYDEIEKFVDNEGFSKTGGRFDGNKERND